MKTTTTLTVEIEDEKGYIFSRSKKFTDDQLDYANLSTGAILVMERSAIKAEIKEHIINSLLNKEVKP